MYIDTAKLLFMVSHRIKAREPFPWSFNILENSPIAIIICQDTPCCFEIQAAETQAAHLCMRR